MTQLLLNQYNQWLESVDREVQWRKGVKLYDISTEEDTTLTELFLQNVEPADAAKKVIENANEVSGGTRTLH